MWRYNGGFQVEELSIGRKFLYINWLLLLLTAILAAIGVVMLYSAAGGSMQPWAQKHAIRYAMTLPVVLLIALTDIRFWLRYAYVIYSVVLSLLVLVELIGYVGMGSQRWLDLGFIKIQPSELMKLAMVLVISRYFHSKSYEDVGRIVTLIPPLILLLMPSILVLRQPDLGTFLLIIMGTGIQFFLVGVRIWKFVLIILLMIISLPISWHSMKDYQKLRVTTFLNPENDPLGAGYHIMQSKIALGSGGLVGKGFQKGTQSHLNFLPEKRTDFILPMLSEEFGFIGSAFLLSICCIVIFYGFIIALRSRNYFGSVLATGVIGHFFLYVLVNAGMVMGLLPVVGVPLPLVSYGGSAMLTIMASFGFVICVYVHRDVIIKKHYPFE